MRSTIYDLRFTRGLPFGKRLAVCGLLLASLSLASADDKDAKLQQQIIGTWARDNTGEMSICTNGSIHSKYSRVYPNMTKSWNFEGTWQIRDGYCIVTTTNATAIGTTKLAPVGSTDRAKIIKLDDKSLVWEIDNETITFNRK